MSSCAHNFIVFQAGITRCNIDESIDSTNSSSTCQSPMANQRDEAHLLQQSKYFNCILHTVSLEIYSNFDEK